MSVFHAGFSERVFEFSFNAEYAHQNRAVLAAAPHIPTQNEEKYLGYDVAFEVSHRGSIGAIALQHKVCRFVDERGRTNRKFWDAAGGPYFAFRIDVEQFNVIESLASAKLSGVDLSIVRRCSPGATRWTSSICNAKSWLTQSG